MSDLAWGLQITVLGMGLVFGLLALLWGLLTLVQRLDRPDAAPPPQAMATADVAGGPPERVVATVQGLDAELVAAILVATLAHRALRRREAAPAMRSYWPGSLLYASRWVGAGRARQNHSWQRRGR
jgi:glutaconyl-CoA/methylmalonyl-CoA decarboxylase subunit delta